MKNSRILLGLILFGAILRLAFLGELPSGFFRDEAALGYNAYSIWQTGRDEYGKFLPVVFRSFEVFFLPAYVYLSAPLVGLLGPSELSVRLLSGLSGVALLYLAYLIASEIWGKKAGIFAVLFLAISPWHIFYSRGAFEGNLALTLFAAGFYFWIKFLKEQKPANFAASVFAFTLSMYSYQAERLVVPLFALVALFFSREMIWKAKKKILLPSVLTFVFLLPLLLFWFSEGGLSRAYNVSIFSNGAATPLQTGRQVTSLYLSYFSPRNLFVEGDYDRQRSVENASVFYAFLLPLMLVGAWRVFQRRGLGDKLLLAWVFIAPLPAAFTGDPFHTYRSLLLYLPLTLFAGAGAAQVYKRVGRKALFSSGLLLFTVGSLVLFLFNYVYITQSTRAKDWDYGYRELVSYLETLPKENKITIDDPKTQSYIHYLFFTKIPPAIYQSEVSALGPIDEYYYADSEDHKPYKVGNIEFREVDWPAERGDTGKIFAMAAERLPESEFESDPNVELLKEVYYPDKTVAFRIVRIR